MQEDRLPPPAIISRWLVIEDGEALLEIEEPPYKATQWVDVDIAKLDDPESELRSILGDLVGIGDDEAAGYLATEFMDEAVADLINSDEWPDMRAIGPFRKLSLTCLIPCNPGDAESRSEVEGELAPPLLEASRIEVLLTKDWALSVWHPIKLITQSGNPSEPHQGELTWMRWAMDEMVEDTIATDELTTGGDLGIALIRGAIASFSGHRKDLHKRLDDWEHAYYERHFGEGSDDAEDSNKGARNSTKVLAEIHSAGVDLSRELDHLTAPRDRAALHWVGKDTTSPEGVLAAEIYDQKIDRYRISLRDIRDRVRAGLDLSHSVESTARDEASRKRDSFIAKIAAVFLAPTLIAGFYGINTDYPDAGTARGTVEAIVLMILSAVGAWGGIVWFERRDRKKDED